MAINPLLPLSLLSCTFCISLMHLLSSAVGLVMAIAVAVPQCSIGSYIVLNFSLLNNLTNCPYFSLTQGLRTQAEHRQILCQNVT